MKFSSNKLNFGSFVDLNKDVKTSGILGSLANVLASWEYYLITKYEIIKPVYKTCTFTLFKFGTFSNFKLTLRSIFLEINALNLKGKKNNLPTERDDLSQEMSRNVYKWFNIRMVFNWINNRIFGLL